MPGQSCRGGFHQWRMLQAGVQASRQNRRENPLLLEAPFLQERISKCLHHGLYVALWLLVQCLQDYNNVRD